MYGITRIMHNHMSKKFICLIYSSNVYYLWISHICQHLSICPQYMPANTAMQGTYIPQYAQVPPSSITAEVRKPLHAELFQVFQSLIHCDVLSVMLTSCHCRKIASNSSRLPQRHPQTTQHTPTSMASEEEVGYFLLLWKCCGL